MEIQKDFNEREVEYIIIGSYAFAFHGYPRYTGDIDIFINPASSNAEKIFFAARWLFQGEIFLSKGFYSIDSGNAFEGSDITVFWY